MILKNLVLIGLNPIAFQECVDPAAVRARDRAQGARTQA